MSRRREALELLAARELAPQYLAIERARGQREAQNAAAGLAALQTLMQQGVSAGFKGVDAYKSNALERARARIAAGEGLAPEMREPRSPVQSRAGGTPRLGGVLEDFDRTTEGALSFKEEPRKISLKEVVHPNAITMASQLPALFSQPDGQIVPREDKRPLEGAQTRAAAGLEPATATPKPPRGATPLLDKIRDQNAGIPKETTSSARRGSVNRPTFDYGEETPDRVARRLLAEQGIGKGNWFRDELTARLSGDVRTARLAEEERQRKIVDRDVQSDLLRLQKTAALDSGVYEAEKRFLLDRLDPAVLGEIASLKGSADYEAALGDYARRLEATLYADGSTPRALGREQIHGLVSQLTRQQSLQDIANDLARMKVGAGASRGGKGPPLVNQGNSMKLADTASMVESLQNLGLQAEEMEDGQFGPIAKIEDAVLRFGGWTEPQREAFVTDLARIFTDYKVQKTGMAAVQGEEQALAKRIMNLSQNKETFAEVLRRFTNEMIAFHNNRVRYLQASGVDTRQIREIERGARIAPAPAPTTPTAATPTPARKPRTGRKSDRKKVEGL